MNTVCVVYFESKWAPMVDGAKGVFPDFDTAYAVLMNKLNEIGSRIDEIIDIYHGKEIFVWDGVWTIQVLEMNKLLWRNKN